MMKRKNKKDYTILIDIDNVLNNFIEVVLDVYNADHGTEFKVSDIKSYYVCDSLNIPQLIIYDYFYSEEVLKNCKPLKDSVKYLKILNELAKVYIVTARDWLQLLNINKWFSTNYPYIEDRQIIRCRDKHIIQGDIRIDDHYDNLKYAKGEKILFSYPYNADIDLSETMVYRVKNWQECFTACMSIMGYNPFQIENYIEGAVDSGRGELNWNCRVE